jgi:hypothetical protein
LRCAAGVKRCSTSLPAGLAVPLERPISTLAPSATHTDGTMYNIRQSAPSSKLTCKARTPPIRCNSPMPAVSTNSEPMTLAAAR